MTRFPIREAAASTALILALLYAPIGGAFAGTLIVPDDYATIQAAIDAAQSGDTVLVAPGDYVESIDLKPGVTVESAAGPEVTTITGGGAKAPTWGGYDRDYVVLGADDSTVRGFTLVSPFGGYSGVVVFNKYASPTIDGNVMIKSSWGGEVVFNWAYSSPLIKNNVLIGSGGYGIYSRSGCQPDIVNNIITKEWTAIMTWHGSAPTITNNTIVGNQYGVAHYYNCDSIITNNIIDAYAGGIHFYRSTATMTYNNVWAPAPYLDDHAPPYDLTGTAGNISTDPSFVDPVSGDYRLREDSLCIDAGTNEAPALPDTDSDGTPRIIDGDRDGEAVADMGAFEHVPADEMPPGRRGAAPGSDKGAKAGWDEAVAPGTGKGVKEGWERVWPSVVAHPIGQSANKWSEIIARANPSPGRACAASELEIPAPRDLGPGEDFMVRAYLYDSTFHPDRTWRLTLKPGCAFAWGGGFTVDVNRAGDGYIYVEGRTSTEPGSMWSTVQLNCGDLRAVRVAIDTEPCSP
ncbi:MAG: right-handed parallel beta-helix repeat-containing protein [Elusimicrobiota bacterium]